MFRLFIRAAMPFLLTSAFAEQLPGETFESFTEPFRKIDLAPAETGLIAEISIREGEQVRAGQVLASLDKEVLIVTRNIAAVAADSVGRLEAAEAEHRLRDVRLKKLRELHSKGHASNDELQRAEAELAATEGQRHSTEEQRQIDRLEVRKTDAMIERRLIRSPIDGVVTKIHHEQGEFLTPIAPTVVTVTQLNPLRAVFNLPPEAGSQLKSGATVSLTLESDERVEGHIEFVSPIIDADSGTIRVKVLIDNAAGTLHAGRRCFFDIESPTALPTTAGL